MTRVPRNPNPCDDCGTGVFKYRRADRPLLCTGCAIRRMQAATAGMANKQGDVWQNWLASKGPAGRPPKNRKDL